MRLEFCGALKGVESRWVKESVLSDGVSSEGQAMPTAKHYSSVLVSQLKLVALTAQCTFSSEDSDWTLTSATGSPAQTLFALRTSADTYMRRVVRHG